MQLLLPCLLLQWVNLSRLQWWLEASDWTAYTDHADLAVFGGGILCPNELGMPADSVRSIDAGIYSKRSRNINYFRVVKFINEGSYFDCGQLFRQCLDHQFTLVLAICSLNGRAKGGKRLPRARFISRCHRYSFARAKAYLLQLAPTQAFEIFAMATSHAHKVQAKYKPRYSKNNYKN